MKQTKGNVHRSRRTPKNTRETRSQGENAALKRREDEQSEAQRCPQVTFVRSRVGGMTGTEARLLLSHRTPAKRFPFFHSLPPSASQCTQMPHDISHSLAPKLTPVRGSWISVGATVRPTIQDKKLEAIMAPAAFCSGPGSHKSWPF